MDSVTICNMALMAAGIPAITSFEDNNNNAKLCKNFYPVLRDRVLRDHLWSFALTYAKLQKADQEVPDPEYSAVCYLPGDVVRVVGLLDESPYKRLGNRILVSSFPATLVYVRRVEDPNLFDASFIEALQNLISAEVCLSSSRDIQMAQYFKNEYQGKLAIARSIDSQENVYDHQPGECLSSFMAARMGGRIRRGSGKVVFVKGNAGKQGE